MFIIAKKLAAECGGAIAVAAAAIWSFFKFKKKPPTPPTNPPTQPAWHEDWTRYIIGLSVISDPDGLTEERRRLEGLN